MSRLDEIDTIKAMKIVSIFTPCYNEEANIVNLVESVRRVFEALPQYLYEHVFIDNCSTDKTVQILRDIASKNKRVKVILNARNFGHVRSPYYGLMQCHGDAVVVLVADFQDPPEMISKFLEKWEMGYKMVLGIKNQSKENVIMFNIRKFFYSLLSKISDGTEPPLKNFTGFGLYDKSFLDAIRPIDDPYPYFRGMVTDLGFQRYEIKYTQQLRAAGTTKNNLFSLYDVAMLGFVNHSKLPLRLSAFIGFVTSILSFFAAFAYFIYKLVYWSNFELGLAPLIIGIFFFSSVQLFFIGVVGEYIGAIHTQVRKRPMVIEKERINFN